MNAKWVYQGLAVVSAGFCVAGWWLGYAVPRQFVDSAEVQLSQVRSGSFVQKVDGYGSLFSVNQRLISANEIALVDEILLKPGAVVTADTVLMRLKNPTLQQKLWSAKTDLQNAVTARRKQQLEQQRELLEQDGVLADAEADARLAMLQVEAEAPLAKTGVVSAIDFKRSSVKSAQLQQRANLIKQRLAKLAAVHQQQLQLLDDAIVQSQSQLDTAQQQVDELQVRAGINGVLQRMPVSLGQTVQAGSELALVGSLSPLLAQIKVPQLQASMIQLGAKAEIDSRHGMLTGQVSRIDPVVVDGAVIVDLELPPVLPEAIRPMQNVDAKIFGAGQHNVLYLDVPAGIHANSNASVFRMIGADEAQKVAVRFGKISDRQIEVEAGLAEGDRIIISALQLAEDTESVRLTR